MPAKTSEKQGENGGATPRIEAGATGTGVSAEHGAHSPQVRAWPLSHLLDGVASTDNHSSRPSHGQSIWKMRVTGC